MIMAGGDVCLLLPERLRFGDKGCQAPRRPALPRCLFGPPDPAENQRLLQEHAQRERERFQRRWNIDLDALEAAIQQTERPRPEVQESRIPSVEDRLSSSTVQTEEKTSKGSYHRPSQKKSKFQKRVRAAQRPLKRQTCLTEFWRSRRSMSFVFGKTKSRAVLEPPAHN